MEDKKLLELSDIENIILDIYNTTNVLLHGTESEKIDPNVKDEVEEDIIVNAMMNRNNNPYIIAEA